MALAVSMDVAKPPRPYRLRKKSRKSGLERENFPPAAKASIDITGFMYGLKPVPFTDASFSAACLVLQLYLFLRVTNCQGPRLKAYGFCGISGH